MTDPTTAVRPADRLPEDQPNGNAGKQASPTGQPGIGGAPRGGNSYAWMSFLGVVLGILAIIVAPSFLFIPLLEFGTAVVFGILGIRHASRTRVAGGMAVWGLVLGILGLVVSLVMIVVSSPAFQAGVASVRSVIDEAAATGQPAPPLPTEDPVPLADEVITGAGYSYSVPVGWGVPENVPAGADSFAMDLAAPAAVPGTVTVVASPTGVITADDAESLGVTGLEGQGATNVVAQDRVTVAGSESAHITASIAGNGLELALDQYFLTHDDQTYVVSFSSSASVPEGDRARSNASVLTSWVWNEG
jgi:hypothetical protein